MRSGAVGIALPTILAAGFVVSTPCWALAQQEPAVLSGVAFLRSSYKKQPVGESAMTALALIKAEVPAGDPDLQACVARIHSRLTTGSYEPEQTSGHGIYEAAVSAMVLANQDAEANRPWIKVIATLSLEQAEGKRVVGLRRA